MQTKAKKIVSYILMLAICFTVFGDALTVSTYAASVSYLTAKRAVDVNTMTPDGEIGVTLQVTGTPPTGVIMPNDIILLLDKSGSMQMAPDPARFDAMIKSAKEFIDLVDFNSHQVGIVDYSGNTQINSYPLSSDADSLKSYIDTITCGGGTYTHSAITKGKEILETTGREDAQPVIILLTDGEPNSEPMAIQAAQEAKDAGIVFYTIALLGSGVDSTTSKENLFLEKLATSANHHHFVLGSVGLIDIYRAIVKEIGVAAAYNVKITETVADGFEIVPDSYSNNIPRPVVSGNTLTWEILELKASTLNLSYKIRLKDPTIRGKVAITKGSNITYQDYDYKDYTLDLPATNVTVLDFAPEVTAITPAEGFISGGQAVTITGANFREGATVTFGSKAATDVVVVSPTEITAVVPATTYGAKGDTTVTVTNDDKQAATITYLYKAQPEITALSVVEGAYEGGTKVTLTGKNVDRTATIYFGNQPAEIVTYYSNTNIIVKTPVAEKAGLVDVRVVNSDGLEATLPDAFTYQEKIVEEVIPAPEVANITPGEGFITGGDTVTITGANFREGAAVTIGAKVATDVVVVSPTEITAVVPATAYSAKGDTTVIVTNPDKQAATTTYLYKAQPEITALSVVEGAYEGGTKVTLTGKNIDRTATIYFGNHPTTISTYYNHTDIIVITPAAEKAGLVDVRVVNSDGLEATLPDAFTYQEEIVEEVIPAPEVANITPGEGFITGGDTVTITGANFREGATVTIGAKTATDVVVVSDTEITAVVPAITFGNKGEVTVTVTNPDKQAVTTTYLYKAQPEITALSVVEGVYEGGTKVRLTGKNIDRTAMIYFGNHLATISTYYNHTDIIVITPASDVEGVVDVRVVNNDGLEATLADAFTYGPEPEPEVITPIVESLSTTTGLLDGGNKIYIYGSNFAKDNKVYFGNNEATLHTYYSSKKLYVVVPTSDSEGAVDVRVVTTTGEEGALAGAYEYTAPIPEITSISPASGSNDEEVTITITGVNFASGLEVYVDGQAASNVTVVSAKKVTAVVPTSTVVGAVDVKVINPSGRQGILNGGYTYLEPVEIIKNPQITSISKTSGTYKGGNKIYLYGQEFERDMKVYFGDQEAELFTFYSKIRVYVRVPANTQGTTVDIKIELSTGETFVFPAAYTYS